MELTNFYKNNVKGIAVLRHSVSQRVEIER